MKSPIPKFSERYKAQVEAERQYVMRTQAENTAGLGPSHKTTVAANSPTGHARPAQPDLVAVTASIEEAYLSVCSENKSMVNHPQRTSEKPAA